MENLLNALVLLANFVLIPAITYGSQLALGALGVTLVYAVLRFSNFAHGDTMAFGTMLVILVTWWLQSLGVSLGPLPTALLALPFGILGCASCCSSSPTAGSTASTAPRRSDPVIFVIASVGVMFIYNALTRFVIGTDDQRFEDGARFVIRVNDFKEWTGLEEGLALRGTQLLTVVVMLVTVAALFWFLQKTRTGKAMRAYSDNEDLALLSGINPDRVVMITWILVAVAGDHRRHPLRPRQVLPALHLLPAPAADLRRRGGRRRRPAGRRHRRRLHHRLLRGGAHLRLQGLRRLLRLAARRACCRCSAPTTSSRSPSSSWWSCC